MRPGAGAVLMPQPDVLLAPLPRAFERLPGARPRAKLRSIMVSFAVLFPDIFIVLGCEIRTVLLSNYSQGRLLECYL